MRGRIRRHMTHFFLLSIGLALAIGLSVTFIIAGIVDYVNMPDAKMKSKDEDDHRYGSHYSLAFAFGFAGLIISFFCCYHTACSKSAMKARHDMFLKELTSKRTLKLRRKRGAMAMKVVYREVKEDEAEQ